ncbi:MAG: glycosyltransferase family 4 protein [Anaerolineales bacterium]|nr:glycosyltransferase family 4 protein [Anaerolineales bacterium]
MKILHVVQGYTPAIGGTELLFQRVSEELVTQFGDQVTVFTTNCFSAEAFATPRAPRMPTGWETINGVRVRRFPVLSRLSQPLVLLAPYMWLPGSQYIRTLFMGPIIPGLSKAIQACDFDIAIASSFPLLHMFTTLSAAHKSKRPCVLMGGLHPEDKWGFDRPIIYQAIQKAEAYISNTDYEAQYITARRVSPEKINVVGVGADLKPFEGVEYGPARQRLGVPEGTPLVGFIGQVAWRKGVETLVRAMTQVWQAIPSAQLLIAGAKTLYAEQLNQLLAKLPPDQRQKIILLYNFPEEEKPWLFGAIDVFAYPSEFESFGISYLEAWAVQKPVIGCSGGAVPCVIDAGRDGLLVPFDRSELLADALLMLLKNPSWARQLGMQGCQKVRTRYNWPEISRRYRQVYQHTIDTYTTAR